MKDMLIVFNKVCQHLKQYSEIVTEYFKTSHNESENSIVRNVIYRTKQETGKPDVSISFNLQEYKKGVFTYTAELSANKLSLESNLSDILSLFSKLEVPQSFNSLSFEKMKRISIIEMTENYDEKELHQYWFLSLNIGRIALEEFRDASRIFKDLLAYLDIVYPIFYQIVQDQKFLIKN